MTPFPPGRFGAIYADPAWPFDTWSDKGKDRSAEKHYPTMSIAEICQLPVAELAADDCCLFLWTTWPRLEQALLVVDSWGFFYKTCAFCWVKTTKDGLPMMGTGFWTRANSEVCLLATRGKPQRRDRGVHQVILAPRGRHSAKPPEIRTRIMRLVDGPYIELFARERAPGWEAWGDQL